MANTNNINNTTNTNNTNITNISYETEEMNYINFDNPDNYKCVDSCEMYFKEIGKTRILTEEEEKALGERILAGRRAEETLKAGATDKELLDIVADGEAAQKAMIEGNLRLVVSEAKRYNNSKLDFMDLIQEGNMGLETAVQKYDVSMGYRFTTYAIHWIRQAMQRALDNRGNVVRIPSYMQQNIYKIKKKQREIANMIGRDATNAEIAEALGMSEKQVEQALICSMDALSLDAPVAEDSDATRGDLIADDNCASPEDKAVLGSVTEVVEKALNSLPEKEAEVLRYRFGFYGRTYTLEEVGEIYGVTRERIRQIEKMALEHIMRKKDIFEDLKDYYTAI